MRLGRPVAYRLVPGANALALPGPAIAGGQRAAFMFRHFWATRYAPDELYPAGWYPNQHPGGDGLPLLDRRRPPARGRERRRLVHPQLPPSAAAGGLAGAALVYAGFHWMP